MGGVNSCFEAGHDLARGSARGPKHAKEASAHWEGVEQTSQDVCKARVGQARQSSVGDAFKPTPRMLSLTNAAGLAGRLSSLPADNPVERLCKETGNGLAVLDRRTLEAELRHFSQPVAVLHVAYVTPTPCASHMDTLNSSIGSPRNKAASPDAALMIQRGSVEGRVGLVFSTEQGSTAVACVLANTAAVNALQLRDEQDMLSFLARSFAKDPSLKVLFQDIIKRLLQGQLRTVNHFVPGDFGRDRYFLSMRIWPFAYRAAALQSTQGGGSTRIQPDRLRFPADGGGTSTAAMSDHESELVGITPAMILELDVPYEGKELAARLQRDYMIISNIPSIVTMFDMDGQVLHQNRSSVAYMGYLVGMERDGISASQTLVMPHNPDGLAASAQAYQGGGCGSGLAALASAAAVPALTQTKGPIARMPALTSHNRLEQLFAHEPIKLQEILMAVEEGTEWRGLVRMPARMQWGTPDGDEDGEEGNFNDTTCRIPNGCPADPAPPAAASASAAAVPVTTVTTSSTAGAAATGGSHSITADASPEPSSLRGTDRILSPSSFPPQGSQRRFTAQLIRELQATVRLASQGRSRSVTITRQASQDVNRNGLVALAADQQHVQVQQESKASQERSRQHSVASTTWVSGDASSEQPLDPLEEQHPSQKQQQKQKSTPIEPPPPPRGVGPQRVMKDCEAVTGKADCCGSSTQISDCGSQATAAALTGSLPAAAAVAPLVLLADVDACSETSSAGGSATFGDTALAVMLSTSNAAAHAVPAAPNTCAAHIPHAISADADNSDSGINLAYGNVHGRQGAECLVGSLRMQPAEDVASSYCAEAMEPPAEVSKELDGGAMEVSSAGRIKATNSKKSVHSVPTPGVQNSANAAHVAEVELPVVSAPLGATLVSSNNRTPLRQCKLQGKAASTLDSGNEVKITRHSSDSDMAGNIPSSQVASEKRCCTSVEIEFPSSGSITPAEASMERMRREDLEQGPEPVPQPQPLATSIPFVPTSGDTVPSKGGAIGSAGASSEVWGFWSNCVANGSTTGSERGPASAGGPVVPNSSISSFRSTECGTSAAKSSTPTRTAAVASAVAGEAVGSPLARKASSLGMDAVRTINSECEATTSTSVQHGSDAEVAVEAMVPGQEDWSNSGPGSGRLDLLEPGSVAPEESSLLVNNGNNYSIELMAHRLQSGSMLQGMRSFGGGLSRGNTAGQIGALGAQRPLAYIDEEKTEDEGVEELSFLLPKVTPYSPPYATPYIDPRLTDPSVEVLLAPADTPAGLPASTPVTTVKATHGAAPGDPRTMQRSLPQPNDSPEGYGKMMKMEMLIISDPPVTATSPSSHSSLQLPWPLDRGGSAAVGTPVAASSSASSLPSVPHLTSLVAVDKGIGRVHSNPSCTSRVVLRDAATSACGGGAVAASQVAAVSTNSIPSSRGTTTYLQHTGMEDSKRLRAVLKALVSSGTTEANNTVVSSGSNAVTMAGHAVTWSGVLARPSYQASSNGHVGVAGAAASGNPPRLLHKIKCHGAQVTADMLVENVAAAVLDTHAAGSVATSRVPLLPLLRVDATRWHEVHVRPCFDPMSSEPLTMVIQTDVTSKVRAEELLARVLEAEHRLLADIFPSHVVQYMTRRRKDAAELERNGLTLLRHIQDPAAVATLHDNVTVLFADIKGFTEMSKEVAPAVVMTFLNDLYTRFDSLTDVYGVYKVETIGDCYMVAGGLVSRDGDGYGRAVRGQGDTDPLHAMRVVAFARAMLEEAAKVALPNTGEPVQLRIGIHSGPATSGVVGQKMPRFCLFGDTINTANRMESTGKPGAIHVSCATWKLLPPEEGEELWAPTGGVDVKGKGRMETFLWSPHTTAALQQRSYQRRRAMLLGTLSSLRLHAVS